MYKIIGKRGESGFGGDIITGNVIYIVLFVVFFGMMLVYLVGLQDGASFWEDFYAKEISRMVNEAEPGDRVCLDVTKATDIAVKRGKSLSNAFEFDNVNNEIWISLRLSSGTGYKFFKDVDIVNKELNLLVGAEPVENELCFDVVEAQIT
jgi:hypothetical protein